MKQHLKRLAAPRTWDIERKEETFIMRPRPGQPFSHSLPLGVVLRMLKVAGTKKEINHVLSNGAISVDGKIRKDMKFPIGLFAVLTLVEEKKNFRMTLLAKGTLSMIAIPESESQLKVAKIKNIMRKKQLYLHILSDGRGISSKEKLAATGGSLLIKLPSQHVEQPLPLEKGATVFMVAGKHLGKQGTIKEVQGNNVIVNLGSEPNPVRKDSLFVIGKGSASITV